MSTTRPVTLGDAEVVAALLRANRDFLAPWEPRRVERYYTEEGQRQMLVEALSAVDCHPRVILDERGQVVGRITLNSVVRGAFQSCHVGYWLAESAGGRGLATAALREMVGLAFHELELHRVQADTLVRNVRSQRVLERAGFVRYALAPTYLKIAGRWQDCYLHQLINPRLA